MKRRNSKNVLHKQLPIPEVSAYKPPLASREELKILSSRHGKVARRRDQADFKWPLTPVGVKEALAKGEFAQAYYKQNPPTGKSKKVRLCVSPAYRSTLDALNMLVAAPDLPLERRANGAPIFHNNNLIEINFGVQSALEKAEMDAHLQKYNQNFKSFKENLLTIGRRVIKSHKEKVAFTKLIAELEMPHPLSVMLENFETLRKDGGNFFAKRVGGNSPFDVFGQACEFMDYIYRAQRDDGVNDFFVTSHGGTGKALVLAATGENALLYDSVPLMETGAIELIKKPAGNRKMQYYGTLFDTHKPQDHWLTKDPKEARIFTFKEAYPDIKDVELLDKLKKQFPAWQMD